MNCAINLFGHLSWLVMQMRKIPSGNQKSSGMRCINTKPQQGLDLSAPGVPPTLSPRDPPPSLWYCCWDWFVGFFWPAKQALTQSAWTPAATQGCSAHQAFNMTQTVGKSEASTLSAGWNSSHWRLPWWPSPFEHWVAFPFPQICSCAFGFPPWSLAHLEFLGHCWVPIYPSDFKMAAWQKVSSLIRMGYVIFKACAKWKCGAFSSKRREECY